MDKFFLPDGYKINPVPITFDTEERSYWIRLRIRSSFVQQFAVYQWAATLIAGHNLRSIADVGCGFAAKLAWLHSNLPDRDYWGIDQASAIALCRSRFNFAHWLTVDLENNPATPPRKFDLVIVSDVIEHLADPDLLLAYIKALVAPGGWILLSTPDRHLVRGPDCAHSPNPYHVREWATDEFMSYIDSRGFDVVEHRLLPAVKISFTRAYLGDLWRVRLRGRRTMRYDLAILARIKS